MPHSVNTYRQRAEAQFRDAFSAPDEGSRSHHLELAEIFRARADLIAALDTTPKTSQSQKTG